MKKIGKVLSGLIVGSVVILFAANYFIRIAADGKSWGIVEELVLGRPLTDATAPPWSDEYKKWDAATKASHTVTDLLQTHGIAALTESAELILERDHAVASSRIAYSNSAAIPRSYLEASNPELPDVYFGYFVPAMDAFHRGLSQQNVGLVREGVSNYNEFLVWMQSRKRSDFKSMR